MHTELEFWRIGIQNCRNLKKKILFELFLTVSFGFDPLISKFIMICIINRCISLMCAL